MKLWTHFTKLNCMKIWLLHCCLAMNATRYIQLRPLNWHTSVCLTTQIASALIQKETQKFCVILIENIAISSLQAYIIDEFTWKKVLCVLHRKMYKIMPWIINTFETLLFNECILWRLFHIVQVRTEKRLYSLKYNFIIYVIIRLRFFYSFVKTFF